VPNPMACTNPLDCFVDMCVGTGGDPATGCSTASICDAGTCTVGPICLPL
jgi:hypothetical protein